MSYDRFGYVWNNPLTLTDPSGELIPLVVIAVAALSGAAISAAVYSIQAILEGNWSWSGFGNSVLTGAIQGAAAPFGPLGIVVGGALSAAAGTAISGGSWSDIGRSALIGGAAAYVGGQFAKGAGKIFNKLKVNGLSFNPKSFISKVVRGAVGGLAGGYGGGLTAGLIETGNLEQAHEYGKQGAVQGLKTGAIAGGTMAVVEARKGGYNLWSGKEKLKRQTTVIGKVGTYEKFADDIGANKFQVTDEKWNSMTSKQRWRMNKNFLRDAMWRGDKFLLSNPVNSSTYNGYFRKEIDFLSSHGFSLKGNSLIYGD